MKCNNTFHDSQIPYSLTFNVPVCRFSCAGLAAIAICAFQLILMRCFLNPTRSTSPLLVKKKKQRCTKYCTCPFAGKLYDNFMQKARSSIDKVLSDVVTRVIIWLTYCSTWALRQVPVSCHSLELDYHTIYIVMKRAMFLYLRIFHDTSVCYGAYHGAAYYTQ